MNSMKAIGFWFVSPFGCLKVFARVIAIYLLSRVADLATTYWFLDQAGFDIGMEANPLMRVLFDQLGIVGGMLFNFIAAPFYLIVVTAIAFHCLRQSKYVRFVRIFPVAVFMCASILGVCVAINNLGIPKSIYLSLSPFPVIQSIYNYSFVVIFYAHPIWVGFMVLFPLYKLGYGKEKLQAT